MNHKPEFPRSALRGSIKDGKPMTVFETFYESLGKRLSQALFDEMVARQEVRTGWSLSTILGFVVAGLVHLFTAALLVFGLDLVVRGWFLIVPPIIGAIILVLVAATFPWPPKTEVEIAPAEDYPTLYGLANRIAVELHAEPIKAIQISREYNAAIGRHGWRRRQVLELGLPLMAVLSPQEIVAVLGHEIAHSVNDDPTRSAFVESAVSTLGGWYVIFWAPGSRPGIVNIAALIMRAVGIVPWLLGFGLLQLMWRQSQRAEYLADYLGAKVGGTDSFIMLLQKLHFESVVDIANRRIYRDSNEDGLIANLRYAMSTIPLGDLKTSTEERTMMDVRLDTTHPVTGYRIRFLEAHRFDRPAVTLTDAEAEALEAELHRAEAKIMEAHSFKKTPKYYPPRKQEEKSEASKDKPA